MRKLFLFFIPIILLISSCEKTIVAPNRTVYYDIPANNWTRTNGGRSYTTIKNLPQVNGFDDNGAVLVYLSFSDGEYEQVPQVYDGISYSYVYRNGQITLEIQNYDGSGVITPPGFVTLKVVMIPSVELNSF